MHSLSLLVFDVPADSRHQQLLLSALRPAHAALLRTVASLGVSRFSEREKEHVIAYSQLMGLGGLGEVLRADPVVGSPELCNDYRTFPEDSLPHSVVASVASALRTSGLRNELLLSQDFSPFAGALPVDATFYDREGGNILAFLEIDGPHHYTALGTLRREDQLKEALYRRAHPGVQFARVSFEQVAAVGTSVVGRELANFLQIIKSHTRPAAGGVGDAILQELYGVPSKDTDGCVTRRAEFALRSALNGATTALHVNLVFADLESDNS